MVRQKKVTQTWPTLDVVVAACAAQRINGQYVRHPYQVNGKMYNKTNRELVYSFLEDQSAILDVDRQMAENIKQFYKGYTFKILSGAFVSEFDLNVMKMLEEECIPKSAYNIAILASLPSFYIKAKQRSDAYQRVLNCQGGYVGTVGERVTLHIEVLKSVFSQKWGVWFITAITSKDQAIFFSYKQDLAAGTVCQIDGTVKRQDNNQTQLNRVKVK